MPAKRRVIVGWRQLPVTKERVRPVRAAPTPRVASADPPVLAVDPAGEKPEEGE